MITRLITALAVMIATAAHPSPVSDKIGVVVSAGTLPASSAIACLRSTGLTTIRIRTPIVHGSNSWNALYRPLANAGYRFLFTYDRGRLPAAVVADLVEFDHLYPGQMIGLEGPNEPDLNPISYKGLKDTKAAVQAGKAPALIALMKDIYTEYRKHFPWQQYDLVMASDSVQHAQLPYAGYANSHIYPNGSNVLPRLLGFDKLVSGAGKTQGYITEIGYSTLPGSKGASTGVTEAVQAARLKVDIPALMARKTIKRAFIFALADGPDWRTKQDQSFGLCRADWTLKPAADVVRGLAQ